MAQMRYKTKNNSDPKGKPKVYFTCHPSDRDRFFKLIWDDISATHDVALYYTEDMSEPFDDGYLETDLGMMNLFVVPITRQLLCEPNRAMDVDIAFAKEENIPILPFMMEPDLNEIYSQSDKFGSRQYLEPNSEDTTAIKYQTKLKKYLGSVLISDETAKRVRAAFDAYIFLSYRKKDRLYARELMKLIHNDPECWDVAIWYDEYLTPGESFLDGIRKALENSKVFALLVTPSLLEYPNGEPNFVMGEEYPAAVKAKKPILPTELIPTDHEALSEKFRDIPDCIDPHDVGALKELLLQSLHKTAITANDRDPEHSFLLGLAYLDGIDVETDRRRGIELITAASDAGLPEAMNKLYTIYKGGYGASANYEKALELAERIYKNTVHQYGKKHKKSIDALCMLADEYRDNCHFEGNYDKAVSLYNKAYGLIQKVYGKKDTRLIAILLDLADLSDRGIVSKDSLHYLEKAHTMQREVLGESHPDTVDTLKKIADFYTYETLFENRVKAVELREKVYSLQCKIYGEDSKLTRKSKKELAELRDRMNKAQAEVVACDRQYRSALETLGENDQKTLDALSDLANAYGQASEHKKAVELHTAVYAKRRKLLGKDHQSTVEAKRRLAYAYEIQESYPKALKLYKQIYSQQRRILGKTAPETVEHMMDIFKVHVQSKNPIRIALFLERHLSGLILSGAPVNDKVLDSAKILPGLYMMLHMQKKAVRSAERVYKLYCNTLGETHLDTIKELETLGIMHSQCGNWDKAFASLEKAYEQLCEEYGATHKEAGLILGMLVSFYGDRGQHQKAIALAKRQYETFCGEYGTEDEKTTSALCELAHCYHAAGEYLKAGELFAQVWKAQCSRLGPFHEDTQLTMSSLKKCLDELPEGADYSELLAIYNSLNAQIPDKDDIDARLEQVYKADSEGDPEKAAILLETIYQQALDDGEEETLDAVAMLEAIVSRYKATKNEKKTAEIYGKIYDLRCELQGEEHEDTLAALHELAYAHFELYNRTRAVSLFEKLFTSRCKILGEEHPDTLTSKHYLALAHNRANERAKALEMLRQVHASRCKVLGAEHADTLITQHRIAHMYDALGMSKKKDDPEGALSCFRTATEMYEQTYASMRKVIGEGHDEALSVLRKLAYVYKELGNLQSAADTYGQEFASRCKVFGEKEHETAVPLSLQAAVYSEMGDHKRSAELYSLLHSIYSEAKGRADWYAQEALASVAQEYSLMGNHQKAAELYGQEYAIYLEANGEDDWYTQRALQRMTEEKEKA